jgi:hypothetical protein
MAQLNPMNQVMKDFAQSTITRNQSETDQLAGSTVTSLVEMKAKAKESKADAADIEAFDRLIKKASSR